jgi:hypothetical protein
MIENFHGIAEVSAGDLGLYDPLLFRFEVDRSMPTFPATSWSHDSAASSDELRGATFHRRTDVNSSGHAA